jgi:hypothetical protein
MNRSSGLLRLALRCVAAATVGFVMITVAAAVLRVDQRHADPGLGGLGPAIDLVLVWVLVLPWLAWILLRIVQVRPAWAVSLLGAVLFLPVLAMFNRPGGLTFTAWQYGLEGALPYGVAALICLSVAAAVGSGLSSAAQARDGQAHDGQAHDGQAHDGQAHDGQAHDGQAHDGQERGHGSRL